MKSLFKDVGMGITKLAQKDLSEETQKWPHEIKQYLLEMSPFVGKYNLNVNFTRIDEENGYGFGAVLVTTGMESDKKVQLPFIIKSNKLDPMDIIIASGTTRPLTESRLSEALFRPQLFDGVVKEDDIRPTGAVGAMMNATPPGRQGMSGMGPTITKASSLIETIKDTITQSDLEKTANRISEDTELRDRVFNNAATLQTINRLREAELVEKTAELSTHIRPTVMQVTITKDDKYKVKTANPKAYKRKVEVLERAHALAKLGSDVVRAVDNVGTITVSTNATVDRDQMEIKHASADTNGVYKVVAMDGSPIKGLVLNKLADLSGKVTEMRLFVHPDAMSVQDDISGEKLASLSGAQMPSNHPEGLGVFYWQNGADIQATVPLIVHSMSKIAEEIQYDVATLLDEQAILTPSAVKGITKIGSEVLIPADAKFLALPGASVIPLASVSDLSYRRGMNKKAAVEIRYVNGYYSFVGDCGLDKLAAKDTTHLEWDDALFLSSCLGMNPDFAETKLAQAVKYTGGTTLRGLTEIRPLEEYVADARAKLASVKDPLTSYMETIRQDLWKEAAGIEDEDTVDKMLSLNYVNPENVKSFVEALPQLEESQRKLCELLLASRIGLKEIDEKALSTGIQGMEKAIQGLKVLLHTQDTE
jgi:hypothetical protein